MKKLLIIGSCLWLTTTMNAQFFNRLIDSAKKSAEDAVEQQVSEKVEEGVEKAFNPEFPEKGQQEQAEPQQQEKQEPAKQQPQSGWTCPACGHTGNTGKFCTECGAKKPEAGNAAPAKKSVESAYAKSDFVPGDEIMFEDNVVGEQMGEFPSKWDLLSGNAEIASVNGLTVINLTDPSTEIAPLMKEPKNYLTEAFTLEFDFLGGSEAKGI